jgi:hypothetical protein
VGGLLASEAVYDRLNELHFVHGERLNNRKLLCRVAAEASNQTGQNPFRKDTRGGSERKRDRERAIVGSARARLLRPMGRAKE